ncbi:MAG TPA: 4-alpha-glucanotransferase [Pseudonocardiaceae bacterium]|nr:4-alpha-glucanotransferase [Pseudonocardiaceae bacterium]
MDQDLAGLAHAYGVATHYENWEKKDTPVDEDVVVSVLAQFDVDASTPDSVRRELVKVRERDTAALPPTIVQRAGRGREVGAGTVWLEDGGRVEVARHLPADLPLGWHRLVTADQEVVLVVVPDRLPPVSPAWGWAVQLYALHSPESCGMGDFADLATMVRRSADELGAGVLLVNPVGAVSPTHPIERSPYSPSSRRFLNPLYLRVPGTGRPVGELIDYDAVWTAKRAALEEMWERSRPQVALDPALRDFATFCALAEVHGPDWREWPEPLRDPAGPGVEAARAELADRVAFHAWLQSLCRDQLDEVRRAAAGMAVGVVHDLPVGVRPGGADTWAQQSVFASQVTVGAPPDAFSQQGQDWNLPPWRPDRLAELGYAPFRDMVRGILRHADGIRVDHVAGLWRLWWIPPGEAPHRGTYVHYDADAMLGILALEAHRAGAVVVGEDLGTVQPSVTRTLHQRGVLSSAVLWFQRDWETPGQPFTPPADWQRDAMASITTHDLPTAAGWLHADHVRIRAELGLLGDAPEHEYDEAAADRAALVSALERSGIPTDDLVAALHALLARAAPLLLLTAPADALGDRRQPNLPGTVDQYPNWRIPLPLTLAEFFADEHVRAVVAPLRAARPAQGDPPHGAQGLGRR